jgi:hypothetical protein
MADKLTRYASRPQNNDGITTNMYTISIARMR